jgi:acyl-CoA ligase (AMP-forming) (exosortase A-associated)
MQNIADILRSTAERMPYRTALVDGDQRMSYAALSDTIARLAGSLAELGLQRHDRIALWLDKSNECVATIFAGCAAGLIVVPMNPKLKPAQVRHVLLDCGAKALVTTPYRFTQLAGGIDMSGVRLILTPGVSTEPAPVSAQRWTELAAGPVPATLPRTVDVDPTAILYTSGSTGNPKGVVISHRNLVEGARSVNRYLGTTADDTILSLLPLSFDAGLSQLTTGTAVGATVVLHNFQRAIEAVELCASERITSITGVPPLWNQLSTAAWTDKARESVRLFASTGGHMPAPVLSRLRGLFPQAQPFLMYGLTEAFRSTYLDPTEIERRPGSIGKAIPNAEILVMREDGSECDVGEVGELVHRGALVTLGYWNDPERTAQRYRPLPPRHAHGLLPEYGVWSGDFVKVDADGFLYFVERRDEMIKCSGYRISPTEIESVLFAHAGVAEAAAIGVCTDSGDQQPVAVVVAGNTSFCIDTLRSHCRKQLPAYMVPRLVEADALPRNPNGKIDRGSLRAMCQNPAITRIDAAGGPVMQTSEFYS